MAHLFSSGFELQSVVNGVEWYTNDTIPNVPAINTTANRVRTGAASLRCQNATSGEQRAVVTRTDILANGVDMFVRGYLWIDTAPDAATSFLGFGNTNIAGAARIILTPSRVLNVQTDTGSSMQEITGSTVLATGEWHRIELRFRRHETTPNAALDEIELRINGNSETSSQGLSIATTPSRVVAGVNCNAESCTTCDYYLDDITVVDSTGSVDNTWPGDGSIETLFPNSAGEFAQTLTLAGSTPAGTAVASVDDPPPIGVDDAVDFVTFTAITTNWTGSGSRLAVNLEPLSVTPDGPIKRVAFGVRVKNTSVDFSGYTLSAQTADAGTKAADKVVGFADATNWLLNSSLSTRASKPYTLTLDPSGSTWTMTTIGSLQFLIRGHDVAPNFDLTSMWATVEYSMVAPGGGGVATGGLLLLGVG